MINIHIKIKIGGTMPQYIYECNKCNKEISITCKMSDYSPTVQCDCGKFAERKIEDLLPQNYIVNCDGFYGKQS